MESTGSGGRVLVSSTNNKMATNESTGMALLNPLYIEHFAHQFFKTKINTING